eukprot:scaffold311089_cov38-Attheya_sp.AAC.1
MSVKRTFESQLLSADDWDKTRAGVRWLDTELRLVTDQAAAGGGDAQANGVHDIRGFLNYVARTYPEITPYLKGVHLTLDHWRPDRDSDGWRISNSSDKKLEFSTMAKPPVSVVPVSRLRSDIDALLHLTESEIPP